MPIIDPFEQKQQSVNIVDPFEQKPEQRPQTQQAPIMTVDPSRLQGNALKAAQELERRKLIQFGNQMMSAPNVSDILIAGTDGRKDVFGRDITMPTPGKATGEAMLEYLTGMAATPVAGVSGLAALPFKGVEGAAEVVQNVQKALTYEPKEETAKQISKVVQLPGEGLEWVGGKAGGALEEAGYPMAGAALHSATVGAPALLGLRNMKKRGVTPTGKERVLDAKIDQVIDANATKILSPTTAAKGTLRQRNKYRQDANTAIREIAARKDNLQLKDKDGNISNKLPETLDEFAQAVDQTKGDIFKQYYKLAKEAGVKGITIPLNPLKNLLKKELNSSTVKNWNPDTARYIKRTLKDIENLKEMTPLEVQKLIKDRNVSLQAFEANPSKLTAGQAAVDMVIQNYMRRTLDRKISKAVGPGYKELKSKYGALRAIEKDANKRALAAERGVGKGLLDYGEVYTVGQIIRGIGHLDPATALAAAGQQSLLKHLGRKKDPDIMIKNMFEGVDKLITDTTPKLPIKTVAAGALVARPEEE